MNINDTGCTLSFTDTSMKDPKDAEIKRLREALKGFVSQAKYYNDNSWAAQYGIDFEDETKDAERALKGDK